MSKDKVDCCLADCEGEDPLLVVIPEFRIDHVKLELKCLALDEVPVGQGGGRLGIHQGPVQPRSVPVITLHHPGDAHVKKATLGYVHVNSSGFFLFGEQDINGGVIQGVQTDVKLLSNPPANQTSNLLITKFKYSQFSWPRRLGYCHGLEVRGEEELVELLPLPVCPGPVAEVCPPAALDVQSPGGGGGLHLTNVVIT